MEKVVDTTDTYIYTLIMPEQQIVRRTLRLTKKQDRKVKQAFAKMYKVDKAKSKNDVIRHLIDTYL